MKYHNSLFKSEETHPEAFWEYQDGMFCTNRTTKPFSGNPIDWTLERMINAEAASQRTGIAAITNSISARRHLAETHFLKTTIMKSIKKERHYRKSKSFKHK